ncbi:DUF2637 domain-containing protein [Streptomyces flavofungini]|uniref:DUF2637 domain-containing protein n=1 Tax=Streptomyces flavofungini TaxID=68200 RepID=UPI0025AF6899|nr:DUF2637 domain-containing protein [Streptomyces flavofungini]WJV51812.1 DUF2637 domain-containing protein [Streptomyces flavofungini]
MVLTRAHRILIGVVVFGAVVIAGIGFAGSYAAVRELAEKKGFGTFSMVFPIGIDAGICVLLALDLLLTWIRIPFPLLRQTAWLLTAATIAFNGAAAWPDPLGVGMHAVIPVLFVVAVEAARHAIGRIADITADKHMEGVRMTRWLLSPVPTFLLWRRMKLWELRSYDQVIKLEQERLVYQARLRSRFGRGWRRKAPVESLMPLRLARYGVPLAETAPAGLAAAGIEPPVLPPVQATAQQPELTKAEPVAAGLPQPESAQRELPQAQPAASAAPVALVKDPASGPAPEAVPDVTPEPAPQPPVNHASPWFAAQHPPQSPNGEGPVSYDPEAPYDERHEAYEGQTEQQSADEQLAYDPRHAQGQRHAPNHEESAAAGGGVPQPAGHRSTSHGNWNDARGAASPPLETASHPSFQPRDTEPAGTPADRTGGSGRTVVQMRIPSGSEADTPHTEPSDEPQARGDGPRDGETAEADPTAPPSTLKGVELVAHHYRLMPPEVVQMSANELAPQLAEQTGYAVGTVRKYIGQIRAQAAAIQA